MDEKYLICHKTLQMKHNEEPSIIEGEKYLVVHESDEHYTIISELGSHLFTKYPDEDGFSYENWLREEDDNA